MRILGEVIEIFAPPVFNVRYDLLGDNVVATLTIGHNDTGFAPGRLENLIEKRLGCTGIPSRLHQNVQYHAIAVDCSPKIVALAIDLDKDFI